MAPVNLVLIARDNLFQGMAVDSNGVYWVLGRHTTNTNDLRLVGVEYGSSTGSYYNIEADPLYVLHETAMAIDGNDVLHIAFQALSDTPQIGYVQFNCVSGTWGSISTAATCEDLPQVDGGGLDIDIDSSNNPHIVYADFVTLKGTQVDNVYYTWHNGSSWQTPEQVGLRATKTDVYSFPKLTLCANDDVEVVYAFQTDTDLAYRRRNGSWGTESVYAGTTFALPDEVTITPGDTVYRYWHDFDGANNSLYENNSDTGYDLYPATGSAYKVASYLLGSERYVISRPTKFTLEVLSNTGSGWSSTPISATGTNATGIKEVEGTWQYNHWNEPSGTFGYTYIDGGTSYFDFYPPLSPGDTVQLNTLNLASSAESIKFNFSIPLNTLTLASSAEGVTSKVDVTVTLNELTLASSSPAITVDYAEEVVIPLNELTLASSLEALNDVTPGEAIVVLNELLLSGSAEALALIAGEATVSLNELTLASTADPLTDVTPGEATVALNELTLASSAEAITPTVDQSVVLNELTLTSSAEGISFSIPSEIDIYNNQGRMIISGVTGSYARAIATGMTDTADVDASFSFKVSDIGSQSKLRLWLRASGDWADWETPTTGYEVELDTNTGDLVLYSVTGSSRNSLDTGSWTPSTDLYWMRLITEGTTIQARVWEDAVGEPDTWDLDVVDSTITDAGTLQLGLFAETFGSNGVFVDDLNARAPTRVRADTLTLASTIGSITLNFSIPLDTLVLAGSAESITPVIVEAVQVVLNELTLSGSAEIITLVPGEVTITLNELTLVSSPEDITLAVGAVIVALSELNLTASPEALTVIAGVVSTLLNTLTLVSSAEQLAILSTVSVLLNELTLVASAEQLTVLSAVSLLLNELTLTSSAEDITVIAGAVTTLLDTLILNGSAEALSLSVTAGVLLNTLTLTSSAENISIIAGTVSTILDTLILNGSMPTVNVVIGDVPVLLNELTLASSAEQITVSAGAISVLLNELSATFSAENITVVPGVVSVLLNSLFGSLSAENITLSAGAVSILLNALTGTLSAETIAVIPGEVSTTLDTLTLVASPQALSIAIDLTAILLDTLTLSSSAEGLTIDVGAVAIALSELLLTASAEQLSVVAGTIVALNEVLLTASAQQISIIPGEATSILQELILVSSAESITLVPGAVSTLLDTLTLSSSAQTITVQSYIGVLLSTLTLAASAQDISFVTGAVSILLDTLILNGVIPSISALFPDFYGGIIISDLSIDDVYILDLLISSVSDSDTGADHVVIYDEAK